MLKTRALESYLSQASCVGISAIVLFNREGLVLSRAGPSDLCAHENNVYASLLCSIWETFEGYNNRDRLTEATIICELGTTVVTRTADMLLAIISDDTVPLAVAKTKLYGLAKHLTVPLSSVA